MNNNQEWRGLEIELTELDRLVAECFEISNDDLPKQWRNEVTGGRSLAEVVFLQENERLKNAEENQLSGHAIKKNAKAENVELYRKQLDESGEIEYNGNINDIQLSKNQQAMVNALIDSWVISEDELDDE